MASAGADIYRATAANQPDVWQAYQESKQAPAAQAAPAAPQTYSVQAPGAANQPRMVNQRTLSPAEQSTRLARTMAVGNQLAPGPMTDYRANPITPTLDPNQPLARNGQIRPDAWSYLQARGVNAPAGGHYPVWTDQGILFNRRTGSFANPWDYMQQTGGTLESSYWDALRNDAMASPRGGRILGVLDRYSPGQVLSPEDQAELLSAADAFDTDGGVRANIESQLAATNANQITHLPGDLTWLSPMTEGAWKGALGDQYAQWKPFLPVVAEDMATPDQQGTGSDGQDQSFWEQLLGSLGGLESLFLMNRGMGGILGGGYGSNSGMDSATLMALMGALNPRSRQATASQQMPLNLQPTLTSIPYV